MNVVVKRDKSIKLSSKFEPARVQYNYLHLSRISIGEKLCHESKIFSGLTQYFIEMQCFYTRNKME